ncbi:hypothetical protein M0802_001360 [Mischocyttarus mexicanus]|nr:hypothetical protein M0802_001360 [Mischocyttarus mexicanus]
MSENDEKPTLSAETIAAIREYLEETEERDRQMLEAFHTSEIENGFFQEDWQLSQFWYDDDTANTIAKGAVKSTPENGKIALISCPTLYVPLQRICGKRQVTVLEYDYRFALYGEDFIKYDYKLPLNIPKNLHNTFDLVIADPPFLSNECLGKTAATIEFLSKNKVVLCTGAVMKNLARRLLKMEDKNLMEDQHGNEIIQIDSDSCDENELTINVEQPHKKKLQNILGTSESEETYDHLIDLCLHKAYCLYKSKTCETISIEEFHLKLSRQIQKEYVKPDNYYSDVNYLRLIGRHFPSQYTSAGKNKLRRCVVCSKNDKRRESRYQCEECGVGLCVVPCFKIFHTEK